MAQRRRKDNTTRIQPGSPEMEAYLGVGYGGMTVAKAKASIAERKANPMSHPYEEMEKAEAFLAAYNGKPEVISKVPGWRRTRTPD